jgi:nitrate reductase / nitrite oxidoreductase, beta subunit
VEDPQDLYQAQLDVFLDPNDPAVIAQAKKDGIPDNWMEAARRSPVYKMAMEWKVAFPLHPEYRTLPMVWYIPPLSPVKAAAEAGKIPMQDDGIMPDIESLRIPVKYLANLLTAGKEEPVIFGLKRMIAMRHYMRSKHIEGKPDVSYLNTVDLSPEMVEEMYQVMAIANYEDRFVIPTGHREETLDAFGESGGCGFSFGNGCSSHSNSKTDLFETEKPTRGRSGSTKDNRVNTLFVGTVKVSGGCGSHSHDSKGENKTGGCGGCGSGKGGGCG